MVQLPTRDALGPLPSARSGRIIANYDTSAAGRGLASLGEQIAGAADTIGRVGASAGSSGGIGGVSQAEKFETNRRFLEFVSSQQQAYEDGKQSVEPGAFGFREQAQKNYLDSAKEFFGTIPDALKPEYDMKLFAVEDDFLNKSRAYETAERTRYYGEEVNKGLTTIESDLFKNPENFDRNFAAGAEHINAIPDEHLSRIQKADLVKQWRAKAQLASLNGVSPQERIRLLGGAPNPVETQPTASRGQAVTRGISGDIRKIVSDAAVQYGVDPDAMLTIAWIESRGNPNAKNPNSSAGGLFQFIDSTARGYGLTNKFDPVQAADAAARLARDNSIALERVLGRKPTAGELYLAHQQGIGGATKLLSNPNARAVDLVGGEAVRLNGGKSDMTAGEFAMLWMKKAGDTHIPDGGFMSAQYDASKADPRFADMNYEVAQKIIQGSQAEIDASFTIAERAQAEQAAAAKVQYDQHKGSVELAIETGELNSELSILNDEVLSDGHKADLLKAYRTKQGETANVNSLLSSLAGDDASGAHLNAFDADDRKLGDKAHETILKSTPPEMQQAATESFVAGTGYIPEKATADVRQSINSGDVQQIGAGLEQAERFYQIAPSALDAVQNGKELKDAALFYSEMVHGRGLSQEQAAQRYADLHSPEMIERRERLKKPADDFVKTLTVSDVTGAFDTALPLDEPVAGLTAEQEAAVLADYTAIAQEKFLETGGDADLAKKMALMEIAGDGNRPGLYGVSKVAGSGIVMKFPPERYYPPVADGHDYIREIAIDDAKGFAGEMGEGEPTNVMLRSAKETSDDVRAGKEPRYELWYQNGDGVWNRTQGLFVVPKDEIKSRLKTDRDDRIMRAEELRRTTLQERTRQSEADADAERALGDTVGPDWMKARAASDARQLRLMQPTPEDQDRIEQAKERAREIQDLDEATKGQLDNSLFLGAP